MRHKKEGKQLGRTSAHRNAMLANMTASFLVNEYIVTTEAKAKACKSLADKIISIAKKQDLHSKRRVRSLLKDDLACRKVFGVLVKRFEDRSGGFVILYKLGKRKGDNASMAKILLVGSEPFYKKKTRKTKAKRKKKEKVKEEVKKKGILDRVKDIRERIVDRGKAGREKKRGQIEGALKGAKAKSRSGI